MKKEEVRELIEKMVQKDPDSLFPSASLKELGFKRYRCSVCGKMFWSSVERKICGDVDCTGEFTFHEKPVTNIRLSYREIWERFSRMFQSFGHTEIKRYPVVARWRDDIYFVEAAIDDFAPYVISGAVEAPANPLVVPQICLRFNDLDNVGLTGRHLTSFIMAEEAAFNTKEKKTYFDKEAIVYIYKWLTEGLGIDKDSLTFIEDIWIGAGYAGNCLEYFAGGLELGNQVYMRYLIEDDKLKELDTRTIDMGGGLERWAWISQRTPTIYEATFGGVVKFIEDKVNVKYSWETLERIYSHLGRAEFNDKGLDETLKEISKKINMSYNDVKKITSDMQAVYSIADHMRTLLISVHDGAIPSNVGGGYNIRTLIRRSLSLINKNNWDLDLNEVIKKHMEEFGSWFTELKEYDISEIINKEKERYDEFKRRNYTIIEGIINRGKVDQKEADMYYRSYGISLSDISLQAEMEGKKISLPERTTEPNAVKQSAASVGKRYNLTGMEKTVELFYDSSLTRASARLIKRIDETHLVFDRTIFYPEKGGQKADNGYINHVRVTDAQEYDGIVVHTLDGKLDAKEGDTVEMEVDTERREILRRHHTATHIINQSCRRILGGFVYQNGTEKDIDKAHIDITYYDRLTDQQISDIEDLANDIVARNLSITTELLDRTEAEQRYGMSIYQGGAIPSAKLRIVKIGDFDVQACGGLHCERTGDVGVIKIVKTERIQDGIIRISFLAYKPAIRYIRRLKDTVDRLREIWGVSEEDVYKTAERIFSDFKHYKANYERSESERLKTLLLSDKGGKTVDLTTTLPNVGQVIAIIKDAAKDVSSLKAIIRMERNAVAYPSDDKTKKELEKTYKKVIDKEGFLIAYG
ncbi:MAG: alanine--tRNA ligase [Candidatus Parvarchaeota archaeon]